MSKYAVVIKAVTAVLVFSFNASAQKKCMFIGATPGRENSTYDRYIMPLLEEWGYVIDKKHNSTDLPAYTDADYAPYDFIFLSETVHSSMMEPLRTIRKPMFNSDGHSAKESALGFALGSPADLIDPAPIVFFENADGHPLAAGFSPGSTATLCAGKHYVWSTPTIPVIKIAGLESDVSKLLVYGVEKGTENVAGDTIDHRVALVGVHAFGYNSLTEAGVKLFQAGIEWVLAEGQTTPLSTRAKPVSIGPSKHNLPGFPYVAFSHPERFANHSEYFNGLGRKIRISMIGAKAIIEPDRQTPGNPAMPAR